MKTWTVYVSETVRKELKWHNAGQKGVKIEKHDRIAIDRYIQVNISEYLDLLNS